MKFYCPTLGLAALFIAMLPLRGLASSAQTLVPLIQGEWGQVASDPDLGAFSDAKQQPVDFGLWQAADGMRQLWSCNRAAAVSKRLNVQPEGNR